MRSLLLFIALLAAGKFGYQDYVYRSVLSDALLNTYKQDAVERCQKESASRNLTVSYVSWTSPESIKLVVGHGGIDQGFFSTSELLPAETPTPYIVIVARKQPFRILCEFDVVRQAAAVYRM